MFLYTSFEILLYVVSIFNTSADAKSGRFSSGFSNSPTFFILSISGLLIISPAKASFFTGTYICRTTDILMIN